MPELRNEKRPPASSLCRQCKIVIDEERNDDVELFYGRSQPDTRCRRRPRGIARTVTCTGVETDREVEEMAQRERSKTVVRRAGRVLANADRRLPAVIPG